MPDQERNERPQEHYHEEWQASNSGCMSHMWGQDVQDRKGITLIIIPLSRVEIGSHVRNAAVQEVRL